MPAPRFTYPVMAGLLLSACAPMGGQVVTVEGRQHTVTRSGDEYSAAMTGRGKVTEAEIYVGNLRAIRDATGCPVSAGTVVNESGRTTAELACPAG